MVPGRSRVQSHLHLHREFKTSLGRVDHLKEEEEEDEEEGGLWSMALWLKAYTILAKDPHWVAFDSFGLQGHCTHIDRHTDTQLNTLLKRHFLKGKNGKEEGRGAHLGQVCERQVTAHTMMEGVNRKG